MDELKTVKEISKMYNVTTMGVRYWINKGLPYTTVKVVGIKPRMMIYPKDVDDFILVAIGG